MLLGILYEPTVILELLELARSLLIDFRVVLRCARLEVYLRLDDVVERLLVVASLSACFLGVKYVIRT